MVLLSPNKEYICQIELTHWSSFILIKHVIYGKYHYILYYQSFFHLHCIIVVNSATKITCPFSPCIIVCSFCTSATEPNCLVPMASSSALADGVIALGSFIILVGDALTPPPSMRYKIKAILKISANDD